MPYQTLHLEFTGEIAMITLSRPEKRNAITAEMIAELFSAFDEVEASPARVLILTGAGKAFCSGMDLDALKALADAIPRRTARRRGPHGAPLPAHLEFPEADHRRRERARDCRRMRPRHAVRLHDCRAGGEVRIPGSAHRISSGRGLRFSRAPNRRKKRARPAPDRKNHRRRRSASPGARLSNRPRERIDDRGANPCGKFARHAARSACT